MGLKGASLTKYGTYRAQIRLGQKVKYLGSFETEKAAHAAFLRAYRQYYGVNYKEPPQPIIQDD